MALGVEPDGNTISYRGGGQKNTPETDPWKFFTNVFAGATLPPDQLAKLRTHRKSMLDYLGKDITAFGARLGTEDRVKIEAHMQSIRDLESALAAETRRRPRPVRPRASAAAGLLTRKRTQR